MIRHILLAKTNSDAAADELHQAFDQISQVAERLAGVLSCGHGPSKSPEQMERGYTHGLVIDFVDGSALHRYHTDTEHKAAGARIIRAAAGGPDGLLVVDLEINP